MNKDERNIDFLGLVEKKIKSVFAFQYAAYDWSRFFWATEKKPNVGQCASSKRSEWRSKK